MDQLGNLPHRLKRLGIAALAGLAAWLASMAVIMWLLVGALAILGPLVKWPLAALTGPAMFIPATPDLSMRMLGVGAEFGCYAWLLVPKENRLQTAGRIVALHLAAAALAVGITM